MNATTKKPAPMALVLAAETALALHRVRAFDAAAGRVEFTVRERHAARRVEEACALVREKWGFAPAEPRGVV